MSFSSNYSPKRGVPLSPGRRSQNNQSYFEKAREVSEKFNELEDKISNLQAECSSFRKALNSGRRLVDEERKQIDLRTKKVQRKINTPQYPSPRSRGKDLIDYSDDIEPKAFQFETPKSYNHISRRQKKSESLLLSKNRINRDNAYAKNNTSDLNSSQNSQMTIPKPNFSAIYANNSFLSNSDNNNDDNLNNNSFNENSFSSNSFSNEGSNHHHHQNSYNKNYSKSYSKNQNRYNTSDSESSFEFIQPAFISNNSRNSMKQNEISPVLSNSMKMYKRDEAELNELVREMRNKILEINERVSEAQKILSEPIDDIGTYQNFTEEAEKSLINVQNRLNSFEENDFEDYNEMMSNIEFIESQNHKRTKELNIKRKRLDELRGLILRLRNSSNSRIQSRSTMNSYSKSGRNSSTNSKNQYSSSLSNELALKKIDEAHEKLKQRSLSIQQEEEAIDKYENELIQKRKQMEQDWKSKMKRIENLSSMKRDIDRLKLNIHSEETEIEQLRIFYHELENERHAMTKRIANSIEESTRSYSNRPQDYDERLANLKQKQRKIDSATRKLKEKRRKISRFEESVRKLIISMKLYNDQVEHIEAQVEEIGQTTEEQLEDLQRETTQLSKSLSTLRSPPKVKNSIRQNRSADNTEEFSDLDNYD